MTASWCSQSESVSPGRHLELLSASSLFPAAGLIWHLPFSIRHFAREIVPSCSKEGEFRDLH